MAKSFLEARKNQAQMVVLEGSGPDTSDAVGQPSDNAVEQQLEDVEKLDPWMRTVTARKESNEGAANTRGPSYKINVVVKGVKTRGFLDHGAQVPLIHKELLPAIKVKQSWTQTECHERDLKMGQQPVWGYWSTIRSNFHSMSSSYGRRDRSYKRGPLFCACFREANLEWRVTQLWNYTWYQCSCGFGFSSHTF